MSILWITGLAGSGKTTLADAVAALLAARADRVVRIDGDAVRAELGGAGRGYARAQRLAVAQQIAARAIAVSRSGACAVVSTISLFHAIHAGNRASGEDYFEVLLDCDAAVLAQRRNDRAPLHGPQVGADIVAEFPRQPHLRLDSGVADAPALARTLLHAWQVRHV